MNIRVKPSMQPFMHIPNDVSLGVDVSNLLDLRISHELDPNKTEWCANALFLPLTYV